jgi:hypothetical protein
MARRFRRVGVRATAICAVLAASVWLPYPASALAEGTFAGGEAATAPAIEAAQQDAPSLLAPSTPATLEGQSVQPAIADAGAELAATGTLTSSTISKEASGEFALNSPVGELRFTPLQGSEATAAPTIINGAVALFSNESPSTDVLVRPGVFGATAAVQLRSPEAPTSFSWQVGLGPEESLEALPGGVVAVVRAPARFSLDGALPSEVLEAAGEPGESDGEGEAGEEEAGEPGESEGESQAVPADHPKDEPSAVVEGETAGEDEGEEEAETAGEPAAESEEASEDALPAAPQTSATPAPERESEARPQQTQLAYQAATSALTEAQALTGGRALMVIAPPTAIDAHGQPVSSSLTAAGDTITISVAPTNATTYPVAASTALAAPSDAASAEANDPIYGLSDEAGATFNPADPKLQQLLSAPRQLRVARKIIPYDTALTGGAELAALTEWLKAVGAVKNAAGEPLEPFLTLSSRACLEGHGCGPPGPKRYRKAVRALISSFAGGNAKEGIPPVKMWGAWNEPDLTPGLAPEAAAKLWRQVHKIAGSLHCGCKVVAGEFAAEDLPARTGARDRYMRRYKHFMVEHRLKPAIWSLHDYPDLVAVKTKGSLRGRPLLSPSYVNADARAFVKLTRTRLGKPRIWMSEQGDLLKHEPGATRLHTHPDLQPAAAEDFLRLGSAHAGREGSRVELVDYYGYVAPGPAGTRNGKFYPHAEAEEAPVFDSALLTESAEPRPAYCVIAFANRECTGGAIVTNPECSANTLSANDDGSTGQIALPFSISFYGKTYSSLWINNNGNITLTEPLSKYTAAPLGTIRTPMIAPFWADVDTRAVASGKVTYGATTYEGHHAFCVDWPHVGYYGEHTDKLNTFQLLLVSRPEAGHGAFDIIFNYGQIQWEAGDASEGHHGLGGSAPIVGFSAGACNSEFFELPGSRQNGAFLDSNSSTGLIHSDNDSVVQGRYRFHGPKGKGATCPPPPPPPPPPKPPPEGGGGGVPT